MTERELQEAVFELAGALRWRVYHTYDSRRSAEGFPDMVIVSHTRHRLIFVELKSDAGRLTAAQQLWLSDLTAAGGIVYDASATAFQRPIPEVYVWRPADWLDGSIERVLR